MIITKITLLAIFYILVAPPLDLRIADLLIYK